VACKPRTTTISGVTAIKFCGPAAASVAAVGKAFRFSPGTCAHQGKLFFAQVGVIGGPRRGTLQTAPLFYLLTDPRSPATSSILYWIVDGKRYRAAPGARIKVTGTNVSFSGRLAVGAGMTGAGAFSGRLTCT
jgi:hypothetical protein